MRRNAAQWSATALEVVLGVDRHLDFQVALDELLGRRLGELTVPTTANGYESLLESLLSWAERFGPVRSAGSKGPAATEQDWLSI